MHLQKCHLKVLICCIRITFNVYYTGSIRKQLSHMHRGFYEIIPNTAITILQEFHWNELQLFLCGQPAINVSFVKSHTQYDGYTTQSNVVIWLWEILEHFSQVCECSLKYRSHLEQ